MKEMTFSQSRKTKPIQTQSNPIQTQYEPNQTQYKANTKPNKANFKGKKMLLSTFLLWDVVRRKLCCLRVYLENVG
jgi:hypothetical protein